MKLPKSFKGISVDKYQRILPIYQKIEKETDSIVIASEWCKIIAILSDKKPHDIEALPIDKLKRIIKGLAFLNDAQIKAKPSKYLMLGGTLYRAKTQAKHFNTAQYAEIKTFLQGGNWIGEMHKLLASMYSPLTWSGFRHDGAGHETHANRFKKASVAKVYPTVFFYSIQFKNSIKRIQEYGLRRAQEENKKAEGLLMLTLRETLESIGDGTPQSTK